MPNQPAIDFGCDPLLKGSCAAVAYARRTNGKRPAKEYIEDLGREDQAKLAKRFIKIAATGKIWNEEQFRKLGGKSGRIYEFKVYPGIRLLGFQQDKTWYLTHGFNKQKVKAPPQRNPTG